MTATCLTLQTPGPRYYKLEAYSKSSSEPAGIFNTPHQSSEAERCANNVSKLTERGRLVNWGRESEEGARGKNWNFLVNYKLTVAHPTFSTCYRRLCSARVIQRWPTYQECMAGMHLMCTLEISASGKLHKLCICAWIDIQQFALNLPVQLADSKAKPFTLWHNINRIQYILVKHS